MVIRKLELSNFRNYETLTIEPDEKINIFYGDNAQGKTNILEAVFFACTTRSHRRSKDRELIRFGEKESHIRLILEKKGIPWQIDMHLGGRKKAVAVNRVPIRRASELLGIANIVFFSPEDLNIIKNGPAERRRFIDMELCQLNRLYLNDLTGYNKCLDQRNRLLKDLSSGVYQGSDAYELLDVWDAQLSSYAGKIMNYREKFVGELETLIREVHGRLTGGKEELLIRYEPHTSPDVFREKLFSSREKDLYAGTTTAGPHRDDILFLLNGIDIRKYGSQGQKRTASLSLKLSEISLVKKETGEMPVLLLDDVLSELDQSRQNFLIGSIGGIQTMITCTGLDEFVKNRLSMDRVFHVENASVTLS